MRRGSSRPHCNNRNRLWETRLIQVQFLQLIHWTLPKELHEMSMSWSKFSNPEKVPGRQISPLEKFVEPANPAYTTLPPNNNNNNDNNTFPRAGHSGKKKLPLLQRARPQFLVLFAHAPGALEKLFLFQLPLLLPRRNPHYCCPWSFYRSVDKTTQTSDYNPMGTGEGPPIWFKNRTRRRGPWGTRLVS